MWEIPWFCLSQKGNTRKRFCPLLVCHETIVQYRKEGQPKTFKNVLTLNSNNRITLFRTTKETADNSAKRSLGNREKMP